MNRGVSLYFRSHFRPKARILNTVIMSQYFSRRLSNGWALGLKVFLLNFLIVKSEEILIFCLLLEVDLISLDLILTARLLIFLVLILVGRLIVVIFTLG